MLGEADDQSLARLFRQDVARGNEHPRARARQPRIDAGIGGDDLLVTDAVGAAEIEQRVLVLRDYVLDFADDGVFAAGQWIRGGVQLHADCTACQPCGQPQRSGSIAGLHRGIFNNGRKSSRSRGAKTVTLKTLSLGLEEVADLRRHALTRLDQPDADGVAEGVRVSAAMALDDDPAQSHHAGAVVGARIELATQRAQHRPGSGRPYVAQLDCACTPF